MILDIAGNVWVPERHPDGGNVNREEAAAIGMGHGASVAGKGATPRVPADLDEGPPTALLWLCIFYCKRLHNLLKFVYIILSIQIYILQPDTLI